MYRATDYYDDTLATIAQYLATIDNDNKATVSLPYSPALSTVWPGSIANSSLK